MKLGLMLGYSGPEMNLPVELVQQAETLGFDSVWTAEAYGSDATSPLAYLAALTNRIRLGTSIVLGLVAAGTTTASATAAVSNIVGTSVVAIPWALLGAATAGAVIVVASVSVMTTLAETRQRPVDVAGARE